MEKVFIKIKKKVSLAIFEEPCVAERMNLLFNSLKEDIHQRIDEILASLNAEYSTSLSFENIFALFKTYFCRYILTEAIKIALTEKGKYNLINNVLSLLSESTLNDAITGEIMIDAFIDVLKSDNCCSASHRRTKIFLLENFSTD